MTTAFVYVTDRRGFDLAAHSAMSVSLSQPGSCDIHIFCYRFMPEHASDIRAAMAGVGADLTFHSISNHALEHHSTYGHVTTPALLKLPAVEALTGSYDRLAYLDNDILVFDCLNIEAIDFGTEPLAAVLDMDLSQKGSLRGSVWSGGSREIQDFGHYFNSGLMIFDSNNFRRKDYILDYAVALDDHERNCSFKIDCRSVDQCALNMTFAGNWLRLPLGFNTQAGARHYCGTRKFLPMSLFRNDSRDVRYLNRIRDKLNLPTTGFPLLYEALFRLNVLRNYRTDLPMRRYLEAVQALYATPYRARS